MRARQTDRRTDSSQSEGWRREGESGLEGKGSVGRRHEDEVTGGAGLAAEAAVMSAERHRERVVLWCEWLTDEMSARPAVQLTQSER